MESALINPLRNTNFTLQLILKYLTSANSSVVLKCEGNIENTCFNLKICVLCYALLSAVNHLNMIHRLFDGLAFLKGKLGTHGILYTI